jgi:hypothetical protein
MDHLIKNNLLRDSQHGFMPNRSCTTNLLDFLEVVTGAVDRGDLFDIIFLDFAKRWTKYRKKGYWRNFVHTGFRASHWPGSNPGCREGGREL